MDNLSDELLCFSSPMISFARENLWRIEKQNVNENELY